ncbi:MAG TPA: amidohydrolase family protein [Bauldia sp.]|nr:amidohydrolase family protein [Bauldia sp.]
MPDFPIIDSHVHVYDPNALPYDWMKGEPLLGKPHLPAYFKERSAPVTIDRYVFVEVDVRDGHQLEEARWVAAQAKADPRLSGIVASAPLERGARAVEGLVADLAKIPLVRSIRRLIQGHVDEPGWCIRPDFVEAVKLLPKYNLGFDICIYHPQLGDAIELVRRCPEVSFILDHIGKPGIKAGIREPWWRQMRELAKLPNVVCKVSGVATEADHKAWTYDQIAPYVAHAIECFGYDRCAFGSDWSVAELAIRYPDWVATLDRITSGESPGNLRKLYRETASRFYRL